jgi:hypothetical protein
MKHIYIAVFFIALYFVAIPPAYAKTIFSDDFSRYLSDTQTKYIPQHGTFHDACSNPGVWFMNGEHGSAIASIIHTERSFIPPLDPSGGAAARLGYHSKDDKHLSMALHKNWERNTEYTLNIRSRIANERGEIGDGTEKGMVQLSVATLNSPENNNVIWLRSIFEHHVPSTEWITTTLTFNANENPKAIGKPIVLRVSHKEANTPGYFTWIDSITLEAIGPETPDISPVQQAEKPSSPTSISIQRQAQYVAEQAKKEFGLTQEQKTTVYENRMLFIQCLNEINKMNDEGKHVEAEKYKTMVNETFEQSMLQLVGTDSLDHLKAFINRMNAVLHN